MLTTTNLHLKKPEGTDIVNIDDLNGNMDILDNAAANKVDKVAGKQLSTEDYTTAEKIKLVGIAEGATNYTHPANHPASIIVQDADNRFVTDAEKTSWNAKETPGGAQAKADIVQANLSAHTNSAAPHSGHVSHALATAPNDFLAASGAGAFVKKTPAEVKTILGLGSAAYTDSAAYATAEQGAKADAATPQTDFASHLADTAAINVGDYGAVHDADSTVAINNAIADAAAKGARTVNITRPGTYLINAAIGIQMRSNIDLYIGKGVALKVIPNNLEIYRTVNLNGINNVRIYGEGTIQGDRSEHTGVTGEWGWGIFIAGCSNIIVDGLTIKDCWGDGIDITAGGNNVKSSNIKILNVTCDNSRRNGMTLSGAENVLVENSWFINTNGTPPQAGVDLEPDLPIEYNDKISFRNCHMINNVAYGLMVTTQNTQGLTVDNCEIIASAGGSALYLGKLFGTNNLVFKSKIVGPSDNLYNVNFAGCDFSIDLTYTLRTYLVGAVANTIAKFTDCNFTVTGKEFAEISGYRKEFVNCKFMFNSAALPDLSIIASFAGDCQLVNCSFEHSGTYPATYYSVTLPSGRQGKVINCWFDDSYDQYGYISYDTSRRGTSDSVPTTYPDVYHIGDIIYKKTPTPGGKIGWVCTNAGIAHLASQGYITPGSKNITSVTNPSTWHTGNAIKADGLPAGTKVVSVNTGTSIVTVDQFPTAQGAYDLYDAMFKLFGAIDA